MDDICPLCDEAIEEWDVIEAMGFNTEQYKGVYTIHKDCALRSVAGGIGHWENHEHWCIEKGDPDGGRTLRQSAKEVAALFRERGISGMFPDAD
jgi:hypothetical protein